MSSLKKQNSPSSKDLNSNQESLQEKKKPKSSRLSSKETKKELSALTYEESLSSLDSILEQLQKEHIPLQDLEEFHRKGELYLDHCEKLLSETELKIIKIDPVDLDSKKQ